MLAGGVVTIDSIGGDIALPGADEASYDATPLRALLTMIVAGRDVRARLGDIRCPALIITSRPDHVINPADSNILPDGIAAPAARTSLHDSQHLPPHDRRGG